MLHLILDIENKIISFGVYGRIQNFQIIGTFLFRCVIAGGMCLNALLLVSSLVSVATDIFTQPRKTASYFSILFCHEAWLVASSLFLWFSERRFVNSLLFSHFSRQPCLQIVPNFFHQCYQRKRGHFSYNIAVYIRSIYFHFLFTSRSCSDAFIRVVNG